MTLPTLSLVMPIRNEATFLVACLESIAAQDYEGELELIVVDGASNDDTRTLLEPFRQKNPRMFLLDNPQRTQTTSLNMAIRRSSGQIIIRLDAHATYAPDYIRQCITALQSTTAACVGGGVNLLPESGFLPSLFGLVQEHPFGTGIARFRRTAFEGAVDTVWPGAYRRQVFEQVGLFREELTRTEDLDLHARLRQHGFSIWQTPLIRPYYRPRSSWQGLVQQYIANGEQVIETLLINCQAISLRHLIPFLWVTFLLVLLTLATFFSPILILLGVYLGIYLLACLGSALSIGLKKEIKYFLPALLVFPLIHLSYGLGSWWGVGHVIAHGHRYFSYRRSAPPTLER